MSTSHQETAVALFTDFFKSEEYAELKAGADTQEDFKSAVDYIVTRAAELMTISPLATVFCALKTIHVFNKPFYSSQTAMTHKLTEALLKKAPKKENEFCQNAIQEVIAHLESDSELTAFNLRLFFTSKESANVFLQSLKSIQGTHWATSDIAYGFMYIHLINTSEAFGWKMSEKNWRKGSKFEDAACTAKCVALHLSQFFKDFGLLADYQCAEESLRQAYYTDPANQLVTLQSVLKAA